METTTNETVVPEHYNPNQLVTYKVIDENGTSFPTNKVVDIEWALENSRYYQRVVDNNLKLHRQLEGELEGWLDNDTSAADIVAEICQIFGFLPEKEIQFEATATITGTVRVPYSELSTFDIDDVDINVYADSSSHDVDVDIEVDNISTID
jgi:hypothetical protein